MEIGTKSGSIEQRIDKLIKRKCKEKLLNHFKTFLFIRDQYYIGERVGKKFTIWKYSYFWTGILYFVIKGEIINDHGTEKIRIRVRPNDLGILFTLAYISIISYSLFNKKMKEPKNKRWNHSGTPVLLILLFSAFITCGMGQEKTIVPQDSTAASIIIPHDTVTMGNQANDLKVDVPWVDPLFFIDGQLCQHLRRIFQDKSGNLWFGTNNYGIMRYNGDTLEYFDKNEGQNCSRITGIVEDKEGNVWFGAYGGITRYDGKSFTIFSEKDGLVDKEVWSLIIDSNGIFWIGTTEGVSQFNGEKFTSFPIPKAKVKDTTTTFAYNRISCILEDKNGIIWFGTDGFGICKYDPSAPIGSGGKTFTFITKEDGLCGNNIYDIMEDTKGNIWIGTMFGGISRYDGKSFTNFTRDGVIEGIEVGGLYEDKSGNIWFAAENSGVYRYDGKSFTNFYTKDGLNTNGILCIYKDREARFWFGGWGGLFRYDGKSFFPVTKDGPWQ